MKRILAIVLCLFISPAFGQVGQILPTDESSKDAELADFLKKLKKAVHQKDTTFIRSKLAETCYIPSEGGSHCDPDIFYTYYFDPEEPNYENIWDAFEQVFAIGGGQFKSEESNGRMIKTYHMPYTSVELLEDREDLMEVGRYSVSLKKDLPVYKQPSKQSAVIAYLDYEIVQTYSDIEHEDANEEDPRQDGGFVPDVYEQHQADWTPVYLDDEKTGYAMTKDLVPLFDVRCCLIKEKDGWKIRYIGYFD